MKICVLCGVQFATTMRIDGKERNLQNRTKCLLCMPFLSSNYQKKDVKQLRTQNALKAKRYYDSYKAKHGTDPIADRRQNRKLAVIQLFGGGCQICNYDKTPRNLAFHHLHDKSYDISSRRFQYSIESIILELRKCILVCHNCHGEIHEGLIAAESIANAHADVLRLLTEDFANGLV